MGFTVSQCDTSLFFKHDGTNVITLLLYVDDIIFTGSNETKFQIQYRHNGDIFLNQSKYAKDLIHKASMDSCKPASTSCKPHTQLFVTEGTPLGDPTMYRNRVGALQYLTFIRPDLSYAGNMACQYMNQPTDVHYGLMKRILIYVQGTVTCGITCSTSHDNYITTFFDSDWAVDPNTRRCITGFVMYVRHNPISWQSKKHSSVSRSSTEAKYKALAHCAADIKHLLCKEKYAIEPCGYNEA
nr:uncharacterized protein LOC114825429 [Malus domestica]